MTDTTDRTFGKRATPAPDGETTLVSFLPHVNASEMSATVNVGSEFGSERPCEIGRIGYRIGVYDYIVLAFRYTDGSKGEKLPWFLTWVGEAGHSPGRLPVGVEPSLAMLAALDAAPAVDDSRSVRPFLAASRGMSTPDSSRVSAENHRAPDGETEGS